MTRLAVGLVFTLLCATPVVAQFDPPPGSGAPSGPGTQPFPGGPPGVPGTTHKEIIPVLIDALTDKDGQVREIAAAALARVGRQAVTPLLEVCKDEKKSAAARANALYALGLIGPEAREALPTLAKAMKDTDVEVRRRAAFAVAKVVASDDSPFGPGSGPPGFSRAPTVKVPDPGLVLPTGTTGTKPPDTKPDEKRP